MSIEKKEHQEEQPKEVQDFLHFTKNCRYVFG
jgi:hypothetical protein